MFKSVVGILSENEFEDVSISLLVNGEPIAPDYAYRKRDNIRIGMRRLDQQSNVVQLPTPAARTAGG